MMKRTPRNTENTSPCTFGFKSWAITETVRGDVDCASDEQARIAQRDPQAEIVYDRSAPMPWSVWSDGDIIGAGLTMRAAVREAL